MPDIKVFQEPAPYTHHQLPSRNVREIATAKLVLAPGCVLNVKKLMAEIAEVWRDLRSTLDRPAKQ